MKSSLSRYMGKASQIIRKKGFRAFTNPFQALDDFKVANQHLADIRLLEMLDYTNDDLLKNEELMKRFSQMNNVKIETINWFVPSFPHAFGGIYTILRHADYFRSAKRIENRFFFYEDTPITIDQSRQAISKLFPDLKSQQMTQVKASQINQLPHADISIATRWDSAPLLLKFNNTKGKFYFIQDYEPLFYPAGAIFAFAQKTYSFGFYGIANTPGVHEVYVKEYKGIAQFFIPAVDRRLFYPTKKPGQKPSREIPFQIFYYARPETQRNGFDLAVGALKKIKAKYGPMVRIITAGSEWDPKDYGLGNTITSLGTLPYEETAKLYREMNLGLVFMFTKHPSYLPFELMASGCPVVSNNNPANTWFMKDRQNCLLSEPTITSVYEKIDNLMNDVNLQNLLRKNGLDSVKLVDWESQIEKIYRFLTRNEA